MPLLKCIVKFYALQNKKNHFHGSWKFLVSSITNITHIDIDMVMNNLYSISKNKMVTKI